MNWEWLGNIFLAPANLAFLGLIPVVILLYLLKLRRTRVVISSTLLWRKSLQDLTANAPFQRLRRNLLLLLQVLILLLVIAGLARPFMKAEGTSGNDLCLMIDRSASMQTREGARTRLDKAKDKALGMIDQMASGDKMMVVTFASGSDVLCELTDDRYQLRNAIRSIAAADSCTRIRDAMLVANSLQASRPGLRTVVVSDGRIADLDAVGARAFDVDFLQVGEPAGNAGIVAFSVRNPSEEGYATSSPEARECLVMVSNDHFEPLHATLTLDWNDEMLAVEEVNLDPKAMGEVVFALPNLETGVLRARLDHDDALALDNTAWLVIRPPSTMKVLLVSEAESAGAYFLKRVLSLNPRVALSAVTPKGYTPMTQAAFDIVMFDGFSPEQLPGGLLLFVNALPPLEGVASEGTLDNPPIIATDPEHPLMRFLNPSNVTISKALKLALPEGARPLISTRGGVLVAEVSRGGQQIVVVAFDLADSNWPLRLSFPLFVQNLIAWAPKAALAAESSVAVGDPLTVLPAPDVDTATVTLPDGRREAVKLDPVRPVYFGNTARAGLYEVQYGEKNETHAVNLLDLKESAVTPAEALTIGRSQVAAQRESVRQNRELWHWLVLTAIGVLTLEWWIYSRRAWA